MSSATRNQRAYDHRLRDLIRSTGDIHQATGRGIPRSTARGWLTSPRAEVITVDGVDRDIVKWQREVLALCRRIDRLIALLRLLILLWKFSGFSLTTIRIPDRARKLRLLRAIDRSHSVLPLRAILRVLGLSHSRYHAWKQEEECGLDDVPSCPRSSPQQLTAPSASRSRRWSRPTPIAMCPPERWLGSHSGSAKSSPLPQPGTGSCASTNGGVLGNAFLRPGRKAAFAPSAPTRFGTSTRP